MKGLDGWTISVCMTVVAAAVLEMVIPENKLGKSVNMLIGVFLVCAIFLPLAGGIHIELPAPSRIEKSRIEANTLEEEVRQQSLRQMEERVAVLTRERLMENGYDTKKISVAMDTLSDGSIEMRQMEILMDVSLLRYEAEIRDIVKNQLGLTADIRFG